MRRCATRDGSPRAAQQQQKRWRLYCARRAREFSAQPSQVLKIAPFLRARARESPATARRRGKGIRESRAHRTCARTHARASLKREPAETKEDNKSASAR